MELERGYGQAMAQAQQMLDPGDAEQGHAGKGRGSVRLRLHCQQGTVGSGPGHQAFGRGTGNDVDVQSDRTPLGEDPRVAGAVLA